MFGNVNTSEPRLGTVNAQKSFGGWGFAPDPDWGAHIAPQTPSVMKGGREAAREEREGRRGEGRGGVGGRG